MALLVGFSAGCSDAQIGDPLDYKPVLDQAASAGPYSTFDPSRLVSDDSFFDVSALTADQVQAFLENTPYGSRSFLADQKLDSGERVSDAVARIAAADQLNPLVFLVTLQKESGLVSARTSPGGGRVDFAMGCGCPDGSGCDRNYRGLGPQLECAGRVLHEWNTQLDGGGATVADIRPGHTTRTADGITVLPANRATALLYTYTPWVQRGSGGNWLFWNIWRRYASALDYLRGLTFPFNEGFIGGSCGSDDECYYSGAVCRPSPDGGLGVCSLACTSVCPDRHGVGWATTFCADLSDGGFCLAQCDPAAPVCDDGQTCTPATRSSQPDVERHVCMP